MRLNYMAFAYIGGVNLGEEPDLDIMTKTLILHWNVPCKQYIRAHEVAFGLNSQKSCQSTKNLNDKC